MSGGCFEDVLKVFVVYLKGVWRLLGGCLEGVLNVSVEYLGDVQMVCGSSRCI